MLHDILSGSTALFADGVQTVLRGHENRQRRVVLLNGNLVGNVRSGSRGISARVTKNGYHGFSSVASYTEEDAKAVIRAATENALFLDGRAKTTRQTYPALAKGLITPKLDVIDTEQKLLIEAVKTVDAYVEKACPKLISRTVVYTEDSQDKIIYTSDAASGHVTYPRCYIYVMMSAMAHTGAPVELFKAFGGLGSFADNFGDLSSMYPQIDALYEKLMDKTEGVYAEAGNKLVILGGMMGGMLAHEAVGHTTEADLVMGGSVAGPCLNKRVGSDLVNLVDFAFEAPDGPTPLPVYLDDEGVTAKDVAIIEKGILTHYMNNRETAERFGMEPAGNARAWLFSDEPLIRMRNTSIHPGKDKLEDMISSIDDGYYLIDSGNGQADTTGEFMFGVTMGYEIKNGKLGRALLDTTISGVAFDMLKTVDMVGDEVIWSSSGFCGKKQPMPVGMGGPALRCKVMIGGR